MRIKQNRGSGVLFVLLMFSSIAFPQIKRYQLSDFSEGLVGVRDPTREPKEKDFWFEYWGKCGYPNQKKSAELAGSILDPNHIRALAVMTYVKQDAALHNDSQAAAEMALAKAFYNKGDYDAAIRQSDAAIRLDPNMALAYYYRGASYQQKSEYYKALVDYNRALHFDPQSTDALRGRADVYYFTHQNRLAIEDYTAFIAAIPKSSIAYLRRAGCHFDLKEYQQSVADYEKAIGLDPNLLEAYNGLAWMMATSPSAEIRNGLKAVGYGEKALSLAGQKEKFLCMDTLAAAYAEAGRFTDAVATQAKVIALIPKDYGEKEVAQFKARLQAYKNNKPWREQPQR